MFYFNGTILENDTVWEIGRFHDQYHDDAICINFPIPIEVESKREALNFLKQHLQDRERKWLIHENRSWYINLEVFKSNFGDYLNNKESDQRQDPDEDKELIFLESENTSQITADLLRGKIEVRPEMYRRNSLGYMQANINFTISYEDMQENNKPRRIFLSHKSADKPLVREYRDILRFLGFDPWMDEDDIKAGDKLHRSIQKGIASSCAAIFFITPNYIDERFLETEIDYAITEATERGDAFRIITLIIDDNNTQNAKVPTLLQRFVFKQPSSQLDALKTILDGLPLKLPLPVFKD